MSVETEIARLASAKQDIKSSVASKGVTIPETETISSYSSYISQIQTGGGSGADTQVYKNILARRDMAQSDPYTPYTITIPNEVTELGSYALAGFSGKVTIVLPSSLKKLGFSCFRDTVFNPDVTVTIPEGITIIPEYCFSNCNDAYQGLTTISLPDSLVSINRYAFYKSEKLESVTVPNGVESIGEYAFSKCVNLTSVSLPSNLTSISACLFEGSRALSSITIPEGVTEIKPFSFRGCTGLVSIVFPETLTTIENEAFDGCTGLISLNCSASSILHTCFSSCNSLEEVSLPNITTLSVRCFYECKSLNTVSAPNVTVIEDGCFSGCNLLENITFSGLTFVGSDSFKDTKITSIDLSNITGDEGLGWGAFYGCSNLSSITFPVGVLTYINGSVFKNCSSLTEVIVPDGVTNIYDAFEGCSGLVSLTIPNSVTSIGSLSGVSSSCTITIDNSEGSIPGAPWGSEANIVYLR